MNAAGHEWMLVSFGPKWTSMSHHKTNLAAARYE
jgi:hypothetical protein